MIFFAIITCIVQLVYHVELHKNDGDLDSGVGDALGYMRVGTWILILYAFLMQFFCGFLLGFHCKLINHNETTNEYLK